MACFSHARIGGAVFPGPNGLVDFGGPLPGVVVISKNRINKVLPAGGLRSSGYRKRFMAYNPYNDAMAATNRIPVSREIWESLSSLKTPGETFDELLKRMIDAEKERRFFDDMQKIEKRGEFVELE
ncbi:MAG: hypothetical protein WAZ20_01085 [Methanothrix sp.]|uniref:hypothetical protein n=2 Tax=Methanothrix sp. TaxID=90426 RepID=UPI0025EB37D1|nr:hypothetical protein [Methanothrix sp.]